MMSLRTSAVVLLATTLTVSGCKPDAALKKAEVIGKGSQPVGGAAPSSDAGRIEGVIHFNGPAPAKVMLDTTMDPNCVRAGVAVPKEQVVVAGGRLANVYVYIKAGAPPAPVVANAAPVVLDQKDCRYIPHVIALQQGGTVEVRNSDPTMHTSLTVTSTSGGGNARMDITQGPMGNPVSHPFMQPETMVRVFCTNHGWMSAFINIAPNAYFAVSGEDGRFTIAGLPPGEYTLAAVHETLGEQDVKITVPPKGVLQADFTFSGK